MKILKSLLLTTFITTSIGTIAGASSQEELFLPDLPQQLHRSASLLTVSPTSPVMELLSPIDLIRFLTAIASGAHNENQHPSSKRLTAIAGGVQNKQQSLRWIRSMRDDLFGHARDGANILTITRVLSHPYTYVPLTEQHMERIFNDMNLNLIEGHLISFFNSQQRFQQKALLLREGIRLLPVAEAIQLFKIFLENSKKSAEKNKLIEAILSDPEMLQKLAQGESLLSEHLPKLKDMIVSRNSLWIKSRGWTESNMFKNLKRETPDLQIFGLKLIAKNLFDIADISDSDRLEAAKALVALDQSKAIESYMSIVTDLNRHASTRLEAAKALVALDRSKAIEGYMSIMTDLNRHASIRLEAAKALVVLDQPKAIEGYLSIATNLNCDGLYRLKAVQALVALDQFKAIEGYILIAQDLNCDGSYKLEAAKELVLLDPFHKEIAINTYISIATDLESWDSTRLEAAKALVALDPSYKEMAVDFLQSWLDSSSIDPFMDIQVQELLAKWRSDLARNFQNPSVPIPQA